MDDVKGKLQYSNFQIGKKSKIQIYAVLKKSTLNLKTYVDKKEKDREQTMQTLHK